MATQVQSVRPNDLNLSRLFVWQASHKGDLEGLTPFYNDSLALSEGGDMEKGAHAYVSV